MAQRNFNAVFGHGRITPEAKVVGGSLQRFVLELSYDGSEIVFYDVTPESIVRLGQQIEKAGRDLAIQVAHEQNVPAECPDCAALAVADPFA